MELRFTDPRAVVKLDEHGGTREPGPPEGPQSLQGTLRREPGIPPQSRPETMRNPRAIEAKSKSLLPSSDSRWNEGGSSWKMRLGWNALRRG
jgi:hypothetical protein